MPPGGEMFRFSETLGENVPVLGRHECLPYSKNAKRVEIYKHQFAGLPRSPDCHFQSSRSGIP